MAGAAIGLVAVIGALSVFKPFAGTPDEFQQVMEKRMVAKAEENKRALTDPRQTSSTEDLLNKVKTAETAKPGDDLQTKVKKSLTSSTPLLLNPAPRVTKANQNPAATTTHWYRDENAINKNNGK